MADQNIEAVFDTPPATGDPNARTIRAVALPTKAVTQQWGRTLRILPNSVTLADRVPLLRDHDDSKAVGKLISSEVTERGLEVVFKVSKTPSGDEILTLAQDGCLGVSLGLRFTESDLQVVGDELHLTNAVAFECSTTPLPALVGADILAVNMSARPKQVHRGKKAAAMPKDTQADVAALSGKMDDLVTLLSSRPEPQPVAVVMEEPPPTFSVRDLKLSMSGDRAAAERIEKVLEARFAVTQGNAQALVAQGYKPELYQGERPFTRTLAQLTSSDTIPNNNSFSVPYLKDAPGPWVADHVSGVEPTLAGGAVWDLQVVVPKPLSGKVSIVQEALDLSDGKVTDLLWSKFTTEFEKAKETRLAAFLDALTLPPSQVVDVDGTDSDLADAFDEVMLALQEPDRFAGVAAAPGLFRDFFRARDEDKRKTFAAVNPVNADGTLAGVGRRMLDINGVMAVQSRDTDASYLVDKSILWQWSTVPQRFDIRTRVASLEVGFFAYETHACLDLSGVIRINHASA
jgi:prohead serine protease